MTKSLALNVGDRPHRRRRSRRTQRRAPSPLGLTPSQMRALISAVRLDLTPTSAARSVPSARSSARPHLPLSQMGNNGRGWQKAAEDGTEWKLMADGCEAGRRASGSSDFFRAHDTRNVTRFDRLSGRLREPIRRRPSDGAESRRRKAGVGAVGTGGSAFGTAPCRVWIRTGASRLGCDGPSRSVTA